MSDLVNNIFAICKSEAELEAIAFANTPLYAPVFGYGDRVNVYRTISNDPDRYDDDNAGTFVTENDEAYWVRIDGENVVAPFTKRRINGAPNWRITQLTETKK